MAFVRGYDARAAAKGAWSDLELGALNNEEMSLKIS